MAGHCIAEYAASRANVRRREELVSSALLAIHTTAQQSKGCVC